MSETKPIARKYARNLLAPVLGSLLFTSVALAAYSPLKLDTVHSKVGFTASTLLFDVDGEFEQYEVQIEGDPSRPESTKVRAVIEVASIDTDNAKRDDHLRSADFFDADKHPKIRFESTDVNAKGSQLTVEGDLTIRGKTKPVSIPFKIVRGKNGAGVDTTTYKGELTIDRNDFGVGTESVAAKISLEDEVDIKLLIVTFPN